MTKHLHTFESVQQIDPQQFARFMVTTLFHQAAAWLQVIDDEKVRHNFKRRLKEARAALKLLTDELEAEGEITETLYDAGEQFEKIARVLVEEVKAGRGDGAYSLLTVVQMLVKDDRQELEDFWTGLGMHLSQKRLAA